MKTLLLLLPLATLAASAADRPYGLVIHGGAGVIERSALSPKREAEYRAKLAEALNAGYAVLEKGGASLDAVTAAINVMEDSPLFNAGKGAVFNADGICELDASIMDGRTQAAGAVAGVHRIKNPINLARDVMAKSEHVMMVGDGAEIFARSLGYEMVPNEYFQTDWRREQLKKAQEKEKSGKERTAAVPADYFTRTLRWGTVGCVALDRAGNLAAGTSTGGMTNKKFGRVGDAPIIGAGTYASNATCAVSATGWGEFFIRVGVARDIAAQMEYRGTPLQAAAAATIAKVGRLGGDGGVIALDAQGNVAMEFNSPGMYRAVRLSHRPATVAIYGDEAK
ncbi:MAG: isoaspartyl peptidase/L-asparaginase [Opitutae bacterium]|nr:isoaspartyl peptidase/L-asparaginase [Opitutae bacterium]